MKTDTINTKDWDISECMSAVRFQDYTIDDFLENGYFKIKSICKRVAKCKIKKCKIKVFLKENIVDIIEHIHKDLLDWIDNKIRLEEKLIKEIP